MKRRIVISVVFLLIPVILASLILFVIPQDLLFSKMFFGDAKKLKKIRKAVVRFRKMTPDQSGYRDFYHNYEAFYREGQEEQRERLRHIRDRVESDPIALALNLQLANYYNWLKTIPQEQQTRINEAATIEERLDIIQEIKERQERMQQSPFRDPPISYWTDSADEFEFLDSKSDEDEDVYPTFAELANFLESLPPRQLEVFLGHKPSTFLFELPRAYRKARENYNLSHQDD